MSVSPMKPLDRELFLRSDSPGPSITFSLIDMSNLPRWRDEGLTLELSGGGAVRLE